MKRFTIAVLAALLGISAAGADALVTLTVTVTNNPPSGASLTVNGSTRSWTNSVITPATQIATSTNGLARAATNLFAHLVSFPVSGPMAVGFSSSNIVTLRGQLNQTISASTISNWATLTLTTNAAVTNLTTVRVPAAAEAPNVRKFVADQLVTTIQDNATSNSFSAATPALAEFVSRSATQTITGSKTFTGATVLLSPTSSNLVNVGSAISSPGSGGESEEFGALARATNAASTALGASALAGGASSTALGAYSTATGQRSIVIGEGASDAGYSNAVVLGKGAVATGPWDIILGAANHIVRVPGKILGPIISNAVYHGTIGTLNGGTILGSVVSNAAVYATSGLLSGVTLANATVNATAGLLNSVTISNAVVYSSGGLWTGGKSVGSEHTNSVLGTPSLYGNATVNGPLRWTMSTSSALANGVNAAVDPGAGAFLKINPGPTAAFTINGIASGAAGRVLAVKNSTGQNMTFANESGIDPAAGNRIRTFTGGDLVTSGNSLTFLIYDSSASRWLVFGHAATSSTNITGVTSYNGASGAVVGPDLSSGNSWSGSNSFSGGFTAPGSGAGSIRIGEDGVVASQNYAIAIGAQATGSGSQSTAVGYTTSASGSISTSVGSMASAAGNAGSAFGFGASASVSNSTAIGESSQASHVGATALGSHASSTKTNQVRLGIASGEVSIPGLLSAENAIDLGYLVPGTPGANIGRLYVAKNGSKFVLAVKWPAGTTNLLALEP